MSLISFKDFSFRYESQQKPTISGINLTINEGEKILIIGPSGSGKSTLARCINGLVPFYYKGEMGGELSIGEKPIETQSIFELSRTIGTVLQDSDGQFVGLTVGEDIAFSLENENLALPAMREQVERVSEMVGMQNHLPSSPHELSGGQKQKTALAGILVDRVTLLLFDEPLANLDPATGKQAIELIDDLQKRLNKTIIIIEHRLEDVLHRSIDRIILMDEGTIVSDLSPDQFLSEIPLEKYGIRPPLYLSALRRAKVSVTKEMLPENPLTMRLSDDDSQKVRSWYQTRTLSQPDISPRNILTVDHVDFSYTQKNPVVRDLSFTIQEGEILSLVGCNGAGKSTLAKLLCRFEESDAGSISLNGRPIEEYSITECAQHVGYVMQNPNQMISKTMIYDEVALGLRLRGVPEEEVREQVVNALKICSLQPFIKWPISALSYGQKKRVTIASVLTLEPSLLILDEPTAGQDHLRYTEIMKFILELNSRGMAILFITHDMHLMLEYTPRVLVMNGGRLVGDTTASELLTNKELIQETNLKETSLYELANRVGISDSTGFVQHFIDTERTNR